MGVSRIGNILNAAPLSEPEQPKIPETFSVSPNNVSFRYSKDSLVVLKNISQKLPAGSFTAIVESSGTGKTILMPLMASMWDVTELV